MAMLAARQIRTDARTGSRAQAAFLAECAVQALRDEALLSPKPALVDTRGSGAHRDLDLARMLRSAASLRGPFADMALAAFEARPDAALRTRLAAIGRVAEQRMLLATQGSNAHRGAIWALGLLLGARALLGAGAAAAHLCRTAARIAAHDDAAQAPRTPSHGARAMQRFGVAGARGQACAGFPQVLGAGLPMLRRRLAEGARPEHARLDALLAIMAELDDTCLLHRGGREALALAQHGARHALQLGGAASEAGHARLLRLDAELLARNASPGGSADLLAAALFLQTVSAGTSSSTQG
ncbi:triphosphoribosyl-dephospho-CoA synthase [Thiomonas sp. FB-6]|uniref:triphosphoribosyl-dephospho-CoA synthase n=1 Tax=Thiomonas sp. FB-6 TaxID=1158291 RepID=UPI000379791F|nr:triphosphoribosyl-dephospho-CoA synthase [Thiomonas sp. FB-6]